MQDYSTERVFRYMQLRPPKSVNSEVVVGLTGDTQTAGNWALASAGRVTSIYRLSPGSDRIADHSADPSCAIS
jgi:hypothetical protein